MTDLEITKACIEAMYEPDGGPCLIAPTTVKTYDPLHDDAQAMALVKKFHLQLYWVGVENNGDEFDSDDWLVAPSTIKLSYCGTDVRNVNLNRAICECVYQLHTAKRVA